MTSPTLLLMCRLLPAQTSSVYYSETDCLCALWNNCLVQSLHVCYAYKKCLHSINNKPSSFLGFLRLFYIFIIGILLTSSNQIVILHLQWTPVCMMFYQSKLITNIETVLCSCMYMCMCAHIHA